MLPDRRVALITGAARGIGAAIAGRLARDGACVAVADLDEAEAAREAERIATAGRSAFPVGLDVANPASARAAVAAVLEREGQLDILVNNAGIAGLASPVAEYPEDEWRRILAIDLDGVFYCCKAVLPHMLERGSGRIVNIASISGKEGNPNMAAYSSAIAGVHFQHRSHLRHLGGSGYVLKLPSSTRSGGRRAYGGCTRAWRTWMASRSTRSRLMSC